MSTEEHAVYVFTLRGVIKVPLTEYNDKKPSLDQWIKVRTLECVDELMMTDPQYINKNTEAYKKLTNCIEDWIKRFEFYPNPTREQELKMKMIRHLLFV